MLPRLDRDAKVHIGGSSSFVQAEDMVQSDFPGHRAGEQEIHLDGLADLVHIRKQDDQGSVQGAQEAIE